MCLKAFCDEAIAEFPPAVDAKTREVKYTYCNLAADYICRRMGYIGFRDKNGPILADRICEVLNLAWVAIDGDTAFKLARAGTLCMSAMSSAELRKLPKFKDAKHGHVAVVYPADKMEYSGSWAKDCPILANVGATNGAMRASKCFPAEPKYYILPGGHSVQGE